MGYHPVTKVTVERVFHPERVIRVTITDTELAAPEVLVFGHGEEDKVALAVAATMKRKSV